MKKKYVACTSFNEAGWDQYGKQFVKTFLEHWSIPLVIFSEDALSDEIMADPRITFIRLDLDTDLAMFMNKWSHMPAAKGLEQRVIGDAIQYVSNYRYQAVKFAHKVFAITGCQRDTEWLIWVDADVVTTAKVDDDFLGKVCPPNSVVSYLGRKEWDHSECGFVGYRVGHPVGAAFLDEFRRIYTSGELFSLAEWHDSYVFDVVREKFKAWDFAFHNISAGVSGNHVWPHTMLGDVMTHAKGPQLKKEIYG